MLKKISVLGAGSWGTALAILLAKNGHEVMLWGRESESMRAMQRDRFNADYLPNITFPESLCATPDFSMALSFSEDILLAIPSGAFRSVLESIKNEREPKNIIWTTKGLEPKTYQLLHEVIDEILGMNIKSALLSGPSFAKEVAEGLPTAVVIASKNKMYAEYVMSLFSSAHFRPYYSDDVIGVEIGGTVKNVMAIGAGISDGLGFGSNTRAALITRGLNEISRLGVAMGARAETFMGLSGLGDLILTCTDNQSRNRRFGLALGMGKTPKQAIDEIGQVVEGAKNAAQVFALAQKYHLDMPITEHVYSILDGEMSPLEAIESLFSRGLKTET
jgi:glycerol-3-phosphate dehydrogenase (NAD(P)+)